MTASEKNTLLEKYCSMWNASYWRIQRFQIAHPGKEELLREEVFEMEIMERRMLDLIPDSYIKDIYDLCAPI